MLCPGMNSSDMSYNEMDDGMGVLGAVTFQSGQPDLERFVQYALRELRNLYHKAQQAGISLSPFRPDYLNYDVDLEHVVAESLVTAQMEETIAKNLRQANESFKQQLAVKLRKLERQQQVVSTAMTVEDTKMTVEELRMVWLQTDFSTFFAFLFDSSMTLI